MYLFNKMKEVLGLTSRQDEPTGFIQTYEEVFKKKIYETGYAIQGSEAIDYLKRGAKLILYGGPVTYYYVDTHPIEKVPYLFANYKGELSPLHPLSHIEKLQKNFDKNAFYVLEEPIDQDGSTAFLLSDEQEEVDAFFAFLNRDFIKKQIDDCLDKGDFEGVQILSAQLNERSQTTY